MTSPPPSLSVVIVTPHDFAHIRRAVRHLRDQEAAVEIELILVAPSKAAVSDIRCGELDGFGATRTLDVGPIHNVDRAAASGVVAASADAVAVIEDHAYVQAGWARAIIDAHRDALWVSVGSVMGNANPRSGLSWANLFLGYGWWVDPGSAGPMRDVPLHNGSYRRADIVALGETLPDRMGRGGDLHDRLRTGGGRMFLAADARINHANPSRLLATADLRFHAGRIYAAERMAAQSWSPVRRFLYAATAPLIPLVRLRRLYTDHLAAGRCHRKLFPRILPGLIVALGFDAAGQAAGFVRGPGRGPGVLAVFEMYRMRHLSRSDRRLLAEPEGDCLGWHRDDETR